MRSDAMPYCPECGVEIGKAKACPLCGVKTPATSLSGLSLHLEGGQPCVENEEGSVNFLGDAAKSVNITPDEGRKIAWEVLTVAFGIAIAILLSINLLVNLRLSWSLYPVASFLFIWICATALLALPNRKKLGFSLVAIAIPAYLIALGLITGNFSWAWRLALPIAIFTELNAAALALAIRLLKRKGLNVLACVFAGIALECIGLEIFIDLFLFDGIRLGWSTIIAIALGPISGFLLYLHVRVVKTTNLRRLFKL
jgi:hypothetical protein